ncbi:MAG: hypothetical protein N4A74_21410 [Carboxylicivirga sp.]|jgi:hypothetical protein|nr:hypothetical protein [Carboxylicivirga sp.]
MEDFLLDDENNLATADGDFVFGDPTLQNQELLLSSTPGQWKAYPTIGIDVESYLLDEGVGGLLSAVKKEFEADGMVLDEYPAFENGVLKVNARYQ